MYAVPRLQTDCRWERVDILHRDMFLWPVIDVFAMFELSEKVDKLCVVKSLVESLIVLVRQLKIRHILSLNG